MISLLELKVFILLKIYSSICLFLLLCGVNVGCVAILCLEGPQGYPVLAHVDDVDDGVIQVHFDPPVTGQ